MNKNHRIFVEKLPRFRVEAESLRRELNHNLSLSLTELRLLNVYDLFGFTDELLEKSRYTVFGERVTDSVTDSCEVKGHKYLAIEFLPGQFDQRAASAIDCVRLIDPKADVRIRSSRLLIFDETVSDEQMEMIRHYTINAVEAREKNLDVLSDSEQAEVAAVPTLEGFTSMKKEQLKPFCKQYGLAMNEDDLQEVVRYFQKEGREPRETELRILDTYWSDHCRHTTFTTELENVEIEQSWLKSSIDETWQMYLKIRQELGREQKSLCLMDLATIGAKYLRKHGMLDDLEVSDENNACSIYVDVDVDGNVEKWLLQFKNETHNHPTEIEPFGGASTCLGGAIRDPLSGRSYVYQAMRVTGAGDIWQKVKDTLHGKLPQSVISKRAAAGYSSYGNQIGLATTHVREVYHEDYLAKRLEVGAVIGAVKADKVRREKPEAGDKILLLGGRTGRDGIGGATGSSKEHDDHSLEQCGSEVQKGNAPEERKLQRLFRREEVTRLIKKSNDFGAGGVSVAIGELADGLDIYLDRVPVKYSGLNATELAISESQERMAVVVEAKDCEQFSKYCQEENIEVVEVADVIATPRMRMFYKGEKIVDLSREFIDSAGAKHTTQVMIGAVEERNPFQREVKGQTTKERFLENLRDKNVLSQRGLIEMFDSTIGRSTVLMPYGGRTQRSETQVSVQKLPTDGVTDTASIMAFGYNPYLTSWSPYHGSAYAVVEAASKVVAAGARYDKMRYSYQEYFERMTSDHKTWGKPLAALLGALKMQVELGLASIGGKDSMSGTFQHINVPPMLMAFGVTTVKASQVISTDFKGVNHSLYLVRHTPLKNGMPDSEQLKRNFTFVSDEIEKEHILSARAIGLGGVAEAVAKMAFGNEIGAEIHFPEEELYASLYGSILVEATSEFCSKEWTKVGETIATKSLLINDNEITMQEAYEANTLRYEEIYPAKSADRITPAPAVAQQREVVYQGEKIEHPVVFIPVFPGTNCDYDTQKAFRKAGAEVRMKVLRNLKGDDILESINEMAEEIRGAQILALAGGFSAGDEPDGSAKLIVNVLNNEKIATEIHALLDRGGLILGICNGFQALVKSGLLPYGRLGMVSEESPTLFRNDINRHISQIVTTRVANLCSPWLKGFKVGDLHSIAVSHGEGRFVVSDKMAEELFRRGQVAFQYADAQGNPTGEAPFNPNGSDYAIEGITSPDGQILGKMGHTERWEENLFKNIDGNKSQTLFDNAVNYFRKK